MCFGFPPRAPSLYKEDEPNVFAEPAILAQQLLPFLLQLLEKVPDASPLRASARCWLEATGPGVLRDLRYCKHLWSQGTVSWGALGCPWDRKPGVLTPRVTLPGGAQLCSPHLYLLSLQRPSHTGG